MPSVGSVEIDAGDLQRRYEPQQAARMPLTGITMTCTRIIRLLRTKESEAEGESAGPHGHHSGWRANPLLLDAVIGLVLVLLIAPSYAWSSSAWTNPLDFGSFIASGRAATAGLDPFSSYSLTFRVPFHHLAILAPNLNPPISVFPLQLAARFGLHQTAFTWYALSILLYVGVIGALCLAYPQHMTFMRCLWALALAGFWHTLELGQIYILLLVFVTAGWLFLRRNRSIAAGICIGLLIAIKPEFAIWPALLFLNGSRRSSVTAFATGGAMWTIPLLVSGVRIYQQWTAGVRAASGGLSILAGNSAIPAVARHVGLPYVGLPLTAVMLVMTATLVWRGRPSDLEVSSLGILAAILVGPLSWLGYTILLLPWMASRRWGRATAVAAAILTVPFFFVLALDGLFPNLDGPIISLYFVALAILMVEALREAWKRRTREQPGPLLPRVATSLESQISA